jgi:putative IMPACT (imprinted ancient) family translation regulator
VVVTRYFGGIKLGTGGLVRAYSDATRAVLKDLPKVQIIPVQQALISVEYSAYDRLKILLTQHRGNIFDTSFTTDVVVNAQFRVEDLDRFISDLMEYTNGNATVLPGETMETAIPYKTTGFDSANPNQNRITPD